MRIHTFQQRKRLPSVSRHPRRADRSQRNRRLELTISQTKMGHIFYVTIGTGLVMGIALYLLVYLVWDELLAQLRFGVPLAAVIGLAAGFGYYLFFKLILRTFTQPFLRQAETLLARPVAPLAAPWVSSEIAKLEELLAEALIALERLDQFSAIAKEIIATLATLDPDKTLERIAQTAVATLPADGALLFLFDEQRQIYVISAMALPALSTEQKKRIALIAHNEPAGWIAAAEQQRCIIAPNWPDEKIPSRLYQAGVHALLSAPLMVGERTIGALTLFNCQHDGVFNDNDLRLVCTYADLAAIAINNARRYQEIEHTRNQLAAILNDTTNVIIVLDETGRILHLNPAAEQYLQQPAPTMLDQPIAATGVADLIAALETARVDNAPVVREVVSFEGVTLQASVSPVQSVGWVVVMQDITPLKELDQLRTEWVAAVSHDMKNPLTVIQMAVGLLNGVGELDEKQQRLAERIQRSATHLRSLVTNVLDLARLKAGPTLQLKAVDPTEIIEQALTEVEPLAAHKGQALHLTVSPYLSPIQGDAPLLVRALVNLLSNAIKYTPEGKEITLSAWLQDNKLRIQVIDTGCGIPAEALPHLFDRFYRVPGSEETSAGTGLGLNIVKSIIDKHQGDIVVASQMGQGSTFTITLPNTDQN